MARVLEGFWCQQGKNQDLLLAGTYSYSPGWARLNAFISDFLLISINQCFLLEEVFENFFPSVHCKIICDQDICFNESHILPCKCTFQPNKVAIIRLLAWHTYSEVIVAKSSPSHTSLICAEMICYN